MYEGDKEEPPHVVIEMNEPRDRIHNYDLWSESWWGGLWIHATNFTWNLRIMEAIDVIVWVRVYNYEVVRRTHLPLKLSVV